MYEPQKRVIYNFWESLEEAAKFHHNNFKYGADYLSDLNGRLGELVKFDLISSHESMLIFDMVDQLAIEYTNGNPEMQMHSYEYNNEEDLKRYNEMWYALWELAGKKLTRQSMTPVRNVYYGYLKTALKDIPLYNNNGNGISWLKFNFIDQFLETLRKIEIVSNEFLLSELADN